MNAQAIAGVWGYKSAACAFHEDVAWIDEAMGRIVCFVRVTGFKHPVPIRLWYEPETPTTIRARLGPEQAWTTHHFRFHGERLAWKGAKKQFPSEEEWWRRLRADEIPEWLEARIVAAYAKMDEAEQRMQHQS